MLKTAGVCNYQIKAKVDTLKLYKDIDHLCTSQTLIIYALVICNQGLLFPWGRAVYSCGNEWGCSNIMGNFDQNNILSDKQHAFRKWHSCEKQLTIVINDWAKILDFEKVFDTLPHELLKSKLFSYGIGGKNG